MDGLRAEGKSQREIANILERNKTAIAQYLANPRNDGTKKRTGRKPVWSKRTQRLILKEVSNKSTVGNKVRADLQRLRA